MMHKNADGIYTSTLFTELGIFHGYSHRNQTRETFLDALGVKPGNLVMGQQVHGAKIAEVKDSDKGKILSGIDGLIYKKKSLQGVPLQSLGVTFADCVPILAVDPRAGVIGTAHAGWKGTLAGIAGRLISAMKDIGADTNDMYISIGPHIGMCHYDVPESRVRLFTQIFGEDPKIASHFEGAWHVDIGWANFRQLTDAGILKEHIDAPPTCTACQVADFNSFRKDTKEAFGVQMGVIRI